jgi:hypothetical protein
VNATQRTYPTPIPQEESGLATTTASIATAATYECTKQNNLLQSRQTSVFNSLPVDDQLEADINAAIASMEEASIDVAPEISLSSADSFIRNHRECLPVLK